MANYRQIHVAIWKDEWFMDLEPDQKLLFIYLFSNESASLSGLYKLPLKVIAFETCLEPDYILKTLATFEKSGKAYYQDGIVWIVNMRRYHETKSDKVQTRINSDVANIPDCELKRRYLKTMIPYQYPIDTETQLKELNLNKNRVDKSNGRCDYSSAQAIIQEVTGWMAIPGNHDDVMHMLGIVMEIYDHQKDGTVEYLAQYWQAFKERYPRSTKLFWLTDWAVQGKIPPKQSKTIDGRGSPKQAGGFVT